VPPSCKGGTFYISKANRQIYSLLHFNFIIEMLCARKLDNLAVYEMKEKDFYNKNENGMLLLI
jgi:hypothetical protein